MLHNPTHIFKGDIIGKEYIFLEIATSTNDAAMEMGRQKEDPEGLVVVADSQTHGKGRMGRKWISPPCVNLYFSVLLVPPFSPQDASIVTLMAAIAVGSAIREYTGLNATIKWPNDILVNGKKAGGILLEMKSEMGKIRLLVLGIGLNVNMPLEDVPEDIRSVSTSLRHEKGAPVDRSILLFHIIEQLEKYYKILLHGDKRALISEWIRLNSTLGQRVRIKASESIISGIAEGINDNGELLVKLDNGVVEIVVAGDVTILKKEKKDKK